jgi:hypothetical protein
VVEGPRVRCLDLVGVEALPAGLPRQGLPAGARGALDRRFGTGDRLWCGQDVPKR